MGYLCSCNSATTLSVVILSVQSVFGHLESTTCFDEAQELLLPPFLRGKLGRVRRAPAPAPFLAQQVGGSEGKDFR